MVGSIKGALLEELGNNEDNGGGCNANQGFLHVFVVQDFVARRSAFSGESRRVVCGVGDWARLVSSKGSF